MERRLSAPAMFSCTRVTCSLDTVCSEPNATDARYLEGLHKTYLRHQHFPRTKPKDMVRNERRAQGGREGGRE